MKEILHIRRDPVVVRIIVVLPIVQLLLVGYAAQMDVEHIPTALCDEDATAASRRIALKIEGSRYFRVVPSPADHRRIKPLLDAGRARVAVIIPRGYQKALAQGRQAQIGVVLDGADATTSRIAAGYLQSLLAEESLRYLELRLAAGGRRIELPPVNLRPALWYNPELKSRDYMVPGVVGLIVLVLTLSLSTVAIVREREVGTLERLVMAPLSPGELVLGKLVPYLFIALFQAAVALALAHLLFGLPCRGDPLFLYGMVVLFAINSLGVGLFMSSLARTQQQAILTNVFFIMPSLLMSGFIAPIRNMPVVVQYLTYAIPLRYFLEIARGVCLKGLTPIEVWPQIGALVGLTVAVLVAGSLMLRRRL